jgi:hypothetical protein
VVNVGGRAAVRWYRVNATTNALIESGTIADPSMAYLFPSMAVNDLGDVVIGMSGTAPESAADPDGTFPSAFAVVGKTSGTGAGTTSFAAPFVTKPGVSDYGPTDDNRWGDYSATVNDPADPSIFWTIQEYVHLTDQRATQVTEIILPQPGEARWKDASDGTVTTAANWLGGALPSSTSHVIFSRATDPAGPGYTVGFDASVDRLSVRQGKVTFNLFEGTVVAANGSPASPSICVGEFGGNPTLTLVSGAGGMGTLAGVNATVASRPHSAGTLTVDVAHLQLSGNLSIGGTDAAAGGTGSLVINVPSTVAVAQTLRVWPGGTVNHLGGTLSAAATVNSGAISVAGAAAASLGPVSGSGALSVAGSATVSATHVRQSSLNMTGGTVAIAPTGVGAAAGTSVIANFTLTDAARFDLGDNKLITNSPVGAVAGGGNYTALSVSRYVQNASNGGAWDGPGLTTSRPDAARGLTSIGVALASDVRDFGVGGTLLFGGQTISPSSTLAMYTYAGDANMDGQITGDDYSAIDFTILDPSNTGGWFAGDFNYDGFVSGDDYSAIDFNILAQGVPFESGGTTSPAALTAVPEACGAMFTLTVLGPTVCRRRRR